MSTARELNNNNVIQLTVINGKLSKKNEVKYKKDGGIKRSHTNKVAGISSEVYAFTTKEEIESMIKVFDKHIDEATNDNQRQIACRNKMLFSIGLNVGLRASDLTELKWSFFFNEDESFKDSNKLQPKKQRNANKFVPVVINQNVKDIIMDYIKKYPIKDMNDYLFPSRKGDKCIEAGTLWKIIKDTAKEAGICNKNIGSHSLRKSFGYWYWHDAEDKSKALVTLQSIFNHSSTVTTMKYIGLTKNDIFDAFKTIELAFSFM